MRNPLPPLPQGKGLDHATGHLRIALLGNSPSGRQQHHENNHKNKHALAEWCAEHGEPSERHAEGQSVIGTPLDFYLAVRRMSQLTVLKPERATALQALVQWVRAPLGADESVDIKQSEPARALLVGLYRSLDHDQDGLISSSDLAAVLLEK